MSRISPAVRKETLYIALWQAAAILPVQAVFLLLNRWHWSVLTGSLLGSLTALLNFLLVGLMVQKAVTQDEKKARSTVKLSQSGRLLMQGAVLVLAAVLPTVFNIWATAIPLLIPRIAVTFRQLKLAKENPAPTPAATVAEDEADDDEDEDEE